jgi:uncharacterized protein (TIGR00251 family)
MASASQPSNSALNIRSISGGVCLDVLVSAGSSNSEVRGVHGNALKVAVRSAPEKGKANKEVEAVLADFFGVGKRSVAVVGGQTSRNKQVQVAGVDLTTAHAAILKMNKAAGQGN